MAENLPAPNSGRKLFFGLFIFPLVIAVGMAILLCSVVFLTNERETPETLIAAIKSGSASKRWQNAYELSNELHRKDPSLNPKSVMNEIISILSDSGHYDAKTRAYMALALRHFNEPEAAKALEKALADPDEEVQLYALWALGKRGDHQALPVGKRGKDQALPAILDLLRSDSEAVRKTAVYVVGSFGDKTVAADLLPLLKDASVDVRWNTALALARLENNAGAATLVGMLDRAALLSEYGMNEEQVERVMINAAKGLALIQTPDSIKILESVAQTDKSLKVRQAALDSIRYKQSNQL